jgi:outer membrane receptor for ferrienterochelin and colicins
MAALVCRSVALSFSLLALLTSTRVHAQPGSIRGHITIKGTGAPLSGARVDATGLTGGTHTTSSAKDGSFLVANLPADLYTLVITRLGAQRQRIDSVRVRPGEPTIVDVAMSPVATQLEQVVTSASRHAEKVVDAPASTFVVTQQTIATRPSLTIADHVKALPGVDVSTGGIVQSNIVTRGFNNAFSTRLLMLQDYRFASVPSLGVNAPYLIPGTMDDVDRVEVVLGPAAALYGPNATDGVLHIITRSPFDSPGTTLTLDGGTRSVAKGAVRHAQVLSRKVAFKLSGEAMTGSDWRYDDPGEPDSVPHGGGFARRDFDVRRLSGEGRLDYRPAPGVELITTYGLAHIGSALELTGANGTAQAKNWTYQGFQERLHWKRFFAQLMLNTSDAGNSDSLDTRGTFLLRSGQPIVDKSRLVAGSTQYAMDWGSHESIVYGADYVWTNPRTGNTINGRNEDDDNVTQVGGYVHSVTHVAPRWDLLAAVRADHSNRLNDWVYSPRAAIVFKPGADHNLRLTFNRAYTTPSNFEWFLDLVQVRNPGGLPYTIRAVGNPPNDGWDYLRSCNATLVGGLCVRSPFPSALGAPNTLVDANAAAYYPAALAAIASRLPASVQPLLPILQSLRPAGTQVSGVLRYLTSPTSTVDPASLTPIAPLKPSFVNELALGYKGAVLDQLRLSLDVWYQEQVNFTTTAQAATPNLFLEPQSLGLYLVQQITLALMAQGMSAAQAQATAAAAAPALAAGLAAVPVGTVALSNARLADRSDIIYTYRNLDRKIKYGGVDLGMELPLNAQWSAAATFSLVNKGSFPEVETSPGVPLRLNAPQHKASLTIDYGALGTGLQLQGRARYTEGFEVNSGVYSSGVSYPTPGVAGSTYSYAPVPTRTLLDARVAMPVPQSGGRVMWSLIGTNLLNSYAPTFAGVPSIGRMVLTRVQYAF